MYIMITQDKAAGQIDPGWSGYVQTYVVDQDQESLGYWHRIGELLSGVELLGLDVMVHVAETPRQPIF